MRGRVGRGAQGFPRTFPQSEDDQGLRWQSSVHFLILLHPMLRITQLHRVPWDAMLTMDAQRVLGASPEDAVLELENTSTENVS